MAIKDKIIKAADKYVKQGRIENAIVEYEKLLEINPKDWGTINLIGDLYARLDKNDEAIQYFNRLGDHYAKDGFYLKAIAIYKKVTKLEPSNMPAYAKLGHLYAQQGLPLEARSNYQIVAEHYITHRQLDKAAEIYKSLAELEPQNHKVRLKLAEINFRLGKKEDAVKELFQIAKSLMKQEKFDEGKQILLKILEMQPDHSNTLFSLADIHLKMGESEKAIDLFNQRLEQKPDSVELNSKLGEIYLQLGEVSQAEEIFKKIAQLAPGDTIAQLHLGLVSLAQGEVDEAFRMMESFIDEAIENKEEEKGIIYLEQILQRDSRHTPTLEKLAKIYISLSQVTPLISTLNTLAEIYIEVEEFQKAYTAMEKLVDLDSENTELLQKFKWLRAQISYAAEQKVEEEEVKEEEIKEIKVKKEKEEVAKEEVKEEILEKQKVEKEMPAEPAVKEVEFKPTSQITILAAEEMKGERMKVLENTIIEAEIFFKYGLLEKAKQKLLSLLPEFNLNPEVHKALKKLYLEMDNYEEAAKEYTMLIKIYGDRGEENFAENEHQEAVELLPQGIIEEDYLKLAESLSAKEIAEIEVLEEEVERVPYIEEEIEEVKAVKGAEEKPQEAFAEVSPPSAAEKEIAEEVPEVEFAQPLQLQAEDVAPKVKEEAPPTEVKPGTLEEAILEALEEVDFYLDQGFPRDAQSLLINLYQRFPNHQGVINRLSKVGISPEAIERGEIAPPALEEVPSAEAELVAQKAEEPSEIESELSEAFNKYEPREAALEQKPSLTEPIDVREDKFVTDEELFAEEESFFNLSSELGEDFLQSMKPEEKGLPLPKKKEVTVEEKEMKNLLQDLKADIDQAVEEEDYETRYNLGIAYKEMDLIDEAIGEFQISLKSPSRYVDSSTMLGLCFMEKGMSEIALHWLHKALEKAEKDEEKHGIQYYIAQTYQQMGKLDRALDFYNRIYEADANFQDVAERIKSISMKK